MGVKAVFNFNNVAKVGVFFPAHVVREASDGVDSAYEDWISKCSTGGVDTDMDVSCESVGVFRVLLSNLKLLNSDTVRYEITSKRMASLILMAQVGSRSQDYNSLLIKTTDENITQAYEYKDTSFSMVVPFRDMQASSPLFYLIFDDKESEKVFCYLNKLPDKIFKDKDLIIRLIVSTANSIDTEVQLEALGRRVPDEEALILSKMV